MVRTGLLAAPVTRTEATLGAAWPDVPDEEPEPLEQPLTRAIETNVITGTRLRKVSARRLHEFMPECMADPFEEVVKAEVPINVAHGHRASLPTTHSRNHRLHRSPLAPGSARVPPAKGRSLTRHAQLDERLPFPNPRDCGPFRRTHQRGRVA
jgi:hypothetical protein